MNESKSTKEILHVIQFYGGRVIPADVSANTGLSSEATIRQLNKLALIMNATLEVNATGDILYCFSNIDWHMVTLARNQLGKMIWQFLLLCNAITRQVLQVMLWFSPIPLMVLVSIFICMTHFAYNKASVVLLIIAALLFIFGCLIQKTFLADCVSFIAGPRRNIRNYDMWHTIAEFIREHGGVVIREQLAQFTGADDQQGGDVFPILVHFDGRPEVTNTGNIIYTFPSLLLTVDNTVREGGCASPEEEPRYEFSDIPDTRVGMMRLYVSINLIVYIGLLYFSNSLGSPLWIRVLDYYCLTFSILFCVYPLCRVLVIKLLNIPIDQRNYRRRAAVANATDLRQKLDEAYAYQKQLIDISNEKIIYGTDKDLLEQQFNDS
jgi:hypothetical protein